MTKKTTILLSILMTVALLLGGCGGGSGTNIPATVSGVAAAGSPLSGTVYLKDSSTPQRELSTPIAAEGSFSFVISGLKPPFMLKAVGTANGTAMTLFSFASSGGVANINPLSHLAVVEAAGNDELATLYDAGPATMRSIVATLPTAVDSVRTVFQPILEKFGVTGVDFISGRYVADHQGLDLMLDMTSISAAGGTVTVVDRTAGSTTTMPVNSFTGSVVAAVPGIIPATGSLAVMPGMVSVAPGGTVAFNAVLVGEQNQNVSWSVIEGNGGTVSSRGVYTAPLATGVYRVKATSADGTASAVAAVTVTASGGTAGCTDVILTTGGAPVPPITIQPPAFAKKAVLKIGIAPSAPAEGSSAKMQPLVAYPTAYGMQASLVLPFGVSVNLSPVTSAIVPPGEVSQTKMSAGFTPLSFGSGLLSLALITPAGMAPGSYVTITCDIAPGFYPTPRDFSLQGFRAYDVNGAAITGVTPLLDVQMVY